jgi:hypothetical protein
MVSEYDVLNLAMCHHPPEWLSDCTSVHDDFCERAQIHLLHHDHRQRVLPARQFMRFAAGAVNPDRHEEGWQPGYNIIRLTACGDCVQVEALILEWQTNPEGFHPRNDWDGNPILHHTLPIRHRPAREQPAPAIGVSPGIPASIADLNEDTAAAPVQEAAMASVTTKDLVFRFWNLRSSDRRSIGKALGVLGESDYELPEPERYSRMIRKVAQEGLVERFAEEIHNREGS